MPARPFVANVCEVLFKGTLGGAHPWVNKLFVSYTGAPPTVGQLNSYTAAMLASLVTHLVPLQSILTTVESVEAVDLSSAMGAGGVASGSTAGTRVGGELPGSTACLVSYSVSRRYRGGHSRSYLAVGVDTDLNSQSTWDPAFVTAVHGAWGAILDELVVAIGGFTPANHVVVSYFGGGPSVDEQSPARLVPLIDNIPSGAYRVQPQLASQRRRIGRK